MVKTVAIATIVLSIAAGARAQEAAVPPLPSEVASRPLLLPPAPDQTQPRQQDEDDDNPNTGWNRVKRGFYSGLIAGSIVGVLLVADCGHPECGPLLTLAAGAGAGIGTALDAVIDQCKPAPSLAMRRDARDAPFARGRRVAISYRKRW